ncbi:MAG: pilus assembly protein TadG-related protein [Acidimicrobiia bacterium]
MNRTERGSIAILTIAVVVLAGMVAIGVARAGHAAGAAARADSAADAAALAAAAALARTEGSAAAVAVAATTAAANGATLRHCDCVADHAEVAVEVDGATGRARAEVRRECQYLPRRCD